MILHIRGIDLFYTKTGTGPALLLVHGNGEDRQIFDEAIDVLKDHFTCYAVDSRGHGQSSPVTEYHYQDMADDMTAFLEALDLTDVTFYGFSDGGIIGLLAAPATPRITRLILSGANTQPDRVVLWLRLVITLSSVIRKDPLMTLMRNEPHITDEWLHRIQVPTLVLAGKKDLIKEAETRHIAAAIPGADLKILPRETHGSYIVHSEKIAREILAWHPAGRKNA